MIRDQSFVISKVHMHTHNTHNSIQIHMTSFGFVVGAVVNSGALVWCGFWLFHLFHLFHSLLFPFEAKKLMESTRFKRYAHIIEVLVVVVCGFTPSIVIINTTGYRYSGFPAACFNDNPEGQFYALILPLALGSTVGCCVLFLSLCVLCKVRPV